MADCIDSWRVLTARSERLIDDVKFECIVAGLLGATAQDVSFAAIQSCLRARLLLEQIKVRSGTPIDTRHGGPPAAQDDCPDAPAPPAGEHAMPSVECIAERLAARQRNTLRAMVFAADAHQRAARTHDRAAALGLGDAVAHRLAAETHRTAQADAIQRRSAFLMGATVKPASDDNCRPLVVDEAP